jgi:hypothetical protein
MTILLARLKQAAKWAWALLAFAGAATFGVMLYRLKKRGNSLGPAPDPIDRALAKYTRTTDEATYRAAVEIAVRQEKDLQVRAELIDALRTGEYADEDAAIDRLIAVGKRVRGER